MESVKSAVVDILKKQGVRDPEHFEAELDSLAFVEFVIELENRFDIRIEETYLVKANFSPLDFVCGHIETLLREKTAAESAIPFSAQGGGGPAKAPQALPIRSRTTEDARSSPAAGGTNDTLPGVWRREAAAGSSSNRGASGGSSE